VAIHYRIEPRARHEARDPRCNGLPGRRSCASPSSAHGELQQWRFPTKRRRRRRLLSATLGCERRIPDERGISRGLRPERLR